MKTWNEYKRNLNEAIYSNKDGSEVDPKILKSIKTFTINWEDYHDRIDKNNKILASGREPSDSDYAKQDKLADLVLKQYNSLVKRKIITSKAVKDISEIDWNSIDNMVKMYK